MEEDGNTVRVIDIDDEKADIQDDQNNTDVEMWLVNDNKYGTGKVQFVENHSDIDIRETSVRYSKDSERNSDDDYIHVIDVDDDYGNSDHKLISAANKIGREYLENKELDEAKDYRIHKRDGEEYGSTSFNGGNLNQIRDKYEKVLPGKNHNMGVRRNRVIRCVKDNRPSETTNNESIYGFQYVTDHHIPQLVYEDRLPRTNCYLPNVLTIPYRLAAVPPAYIHNDTIRPEVSLCMCDYYPIMNRYEHVYRPHVPLRHEFYTHVPMNRTFIPQVQKPDLSTDGYNNNEITKDTNNFNCRPEMLSTHECSRAEINRATHFYTHRPEHIIRLDDIEDTAIERYGYRYGYRQSEIIRNNDYRHAITNSLPYSHHIPDNNLDDHMQAMMSRDVYRPEGSISIEDYERTIRNGHVYRNTYAPFVDLRDPCRSVELFNTYRSHLVNTEAYKEPNMLIRNAYYPELTDLHLHTYRPLINPNRPELVDAYRNEEVTPDLSRKQQTINVTAIRSKDKSLDINKQQNILNTGNQLVTNVPLNVYKAMQISGDIDKPVNKKEQSGRKTTNLVRNNKNTLSVIKSDEIRIDVRKPGVPVTTTRPDTVIFSVGNIYQKNTLAQSDVTASSKSTYDHCHNIQTPNTKETGNHEATLGKQNEKNTNNVNTSHGRKGGNHEKNVREKNGAEKDNNIRFLVVFFSRVKDLVKETFSEFSKSLEKEIQNLGEWTNSGRMKIDIQYICPLYCSVSTYSLPRFDNIEDDNKIEKHVNRTKICDLCSCIQNCYRLYKKKYSDLISATAGDQLEKVPEKINETTNVSSQTDNISTTSTYRTQTVICRREGTGSHEIVMNQPRSNNIKNNEGIRRDSFRSNMENTTLDTQKQSTCSKIGIDKHRTTSLNEKRLLDSLSILNFNLPIKNTDNTMAASNLDNIINNNRVEIVKADRITVMNKEEIIDNEPNRTELDKDNDFRDGNDANLILSLSYNDITKSDIIATNKISPKPDTAFTCHICTCTFTYFTSFVSHMQKEHNVDGIDKNLPDDCIPRKCPFCGIYSKQEHHNDHIKRAHPEIFTHKGEPTDIQLVKVDNKRKSMKRKFIFTCLVCFKNLKSTEVKRHREKEHKGLKVAKMFTKKLSSMD